MPAPRRVSNEDLMAKLMETDRKVDRAIHFLVGDPFDPQSKASSLDGRMTAVENRVAAVEVKLTAPPVEQARRADVNAQDALEQGNRNTFAIKIVGGGSLVALLVALARAVWS